MNKKDLIWMGDSLEVIKSFPERVKRDIGFALHIAQVGSKHDNFKKMLGFTGGVYEIRSRFNKEAYRAVYVLKLDEKVYVLHAFQKKSKRGIRTPKEEVALIKYRLTQVRQLIASGESYAK